MLMHRVVLTSLIFLPMIQVQMGRFSAEMLQQRQQEVGSMKSTWDGSLSSLYGKEAIIRVTGESMIICEELL